jgi:hypothetical protein
LWNKYIDRVIVVTLADFIPIERKRIFFIDKYGFKQPLPPFGYIEGKITQKAGPDGQLQSPTCPVCKKPCGFVWRGGGWADPKAMAFYRKIDMDETISEYEKGCKRYEGQMIKEHWSKYGFGHCISCKAKAWHDFIGGYTEFRGKSKYVDWKYYFKPAGKEDS